MHTRNLLSAAALLFLGTTGLCQMKNVDSLMHETRQLLAVDKRTQVLVIHASTAGDQLTLRGELYPAGIRSKLLATVRERWQGTVVDSLTVLPHPGLGKKTHGVVSMSVANLRTHPEHSEEMATQVLLGSPLRILKKESGWSYVQTVEEYLGWTDDKIVEMDEAEFGKWSSLPKVIVTALYGFAYQEPNLQGPVVSDIVTGDIFWLKTITGDFYEVGYPDGRAGCIRKDDAAPLQEWLKERSATGESIVATAQRFMGIPYLWGGTSAKALDCSGFVKTVYFLNGILLPRDADQQSMFGELVDTSDNFSQVRPGDLLFFGSKATPTRKERVSHVGIAVGGMRYIHESTDVHYNSLDPKAADYSDFRRKGLLRIRRILGSGVRFLKDLSYFQSSGL